MSDERYSRGGLVRGTVQVTAVRGPRREGIPGEGDHLLVYEDECFLNSDAVCVRRDSGHLPFCPELPDV